MGTQATPRTGTRGKGSGRWQVVSGEWGRVSLVTDHWPLATVREIGAPGCEIRDDLPWQAPGTFAFVHVLHGASLNPRRGWCQQIFLGLTGKDGGFRRGLVKSIEQQWQAYAQTFLPAEEINAVEHSSLYVFMRSCYFAGFTNGMVAGNGSSRTMPDTPFNAAYQAEMDGWAAQHARWLSDHAQTIIKE